MIVFSFELRNDLIIQEIKFCTKFEKILLQILNKHTPLKKDSTQINHESIRDPQYIFQKVQRSLFRKSRKINTPKKKKTKKEKNYKRLYTPEKREENFFNKLNTSFLSEINYFEKHIFFKIESH